MKHLPSILLILALAVSCKQKSTSAEQAILVETKGFNAEQQACIEQNLLNGNADLSGILAEEEEFYKINPEISRRPVPIFYDARTKAAVNGAYKMLVSFKADRGSADTAVYSVEMFVFEVNGKWRRILNMGDFKTPTSFLCPHMVQTMLIGYYK